jgi:hypothetical protein
MNRSLPAPVTSPASARSKISTTLFSAAEITPPAIAPVPRTHRRHLALAANRYL